MARLSKLEKFLKRRQNKDASSTEQSAGGVLSFLSLCLFLLVLTDYFISPNILAIISTYPTWLWGLGFALPAIVAWAFFKSKLGLAVALVWLLCAVFTNDHLPVLVRQEKPVTAANTPYKPTSVRVVSSDCTFDKTTIKQLSPESFKEQSPQVVLLQGLRPHLDVKKFADELFGDKAQIYQSETCAVIANGGEITYAQDVPSTHAQIVEWQPDLPCSTLRIVNVNLSDIDPSKSIYSPNSWIYYMKMRKIHRQEISNILGAIKKRECSDVGELPLIVGGNFAVQASAPVFRTLPGNWQDSYNTSAHSYGGNYPAHTPVMRIDRIFASSIITFRNSRTFNIEGAVKKAICADFYPFSKNTLNLH